MQAAAPQALVKPSGRLDREVAPDLGLAGAAQLGIKLGSHAKPAAVFGPSQTPAVSRPPSSHRSQPQASTSGRCLLPCFCFLFAAHELCIDCSLGTLSRALKCLTSLLRRVSRAAYGVRKDAEGQAITLPTCGVESSKLQRRKSVRSGSWTEGLCQRHCSDMTVAGGLSHPMVCAGPSGRLLRHRARASLSRAHPSSWYPQERQLPSPCGMPRSVAIS